MDSLTKTCLLCLTEKPLSSFLKKDSKNGYAARCKQCQAKVALERYHQKPKELRVGTALTKENRRKWRKQNQESVKKSMKKWYRKNAVAITAKRRAQRRLRKKTDPAFKLHLHIGNRLRSKLKKTKNGISSVKFIGCSFSELRVHLSSLFTHGMSWNNQGTLWHIDHIIPKAAFPPTIEGMMECWNYKNLQPLLAMDNMRKSNFVNGVRLQYRRPPSPIDFSQTNTISLNTPLSPAGETAHFSDSLS